VAVIAIGNPTFDKRLLSRVPQRQPDAKPCFHGAHQPRRLRAIRERVNEIAVSFRPESP
jgi:hypothetical protein